MDDKEKTKVDRTESSSFLRRGVAVMTIRVSGAGMTFLVTVMLARLLGVDDYGRYAYIFAIVTLAALPTQFGLPELVVRETSRSLAESRRSMLFPLWRWSHWFIALSSLLVCAAILVAYFTIASFSENAQFNVLAIALLLIPLTAFGNLRGAILRGLGHDVFGQFPEQALRPALFLMGLCVFYVLSPDSLGVVDAYVIQVVAVALATLWGVVMVLRLAPRSRGARSTWEARRKWRKSALFLGGISGLVLINNSVDILMLGQWHSDAEVGRYRVASMVGALITLGLQTMNLFAMPHLSRHLSTGEKHKLARVVQHTTQISFGFAVAALAIILLGGEQGLGWIFGRDFASSFTVVLILASGHLGNAFFGPAHAFLVMEGSERLAVGLTAISTVTNVVLNALLIPSYGGAGAAVATAVSVLLAKFAAFLIVWSRHGIANWPLPIFVRVKT